MKKNNSKNIDGTDCEDCSDLLISKDIKSKAQFLKWARTNHPDKGGDQQIFGTVSNCNDLMILTR